MKTLINTLFIGLLLGGIASLVTPLIKNPTLTIPYPYTFHPNSYKQQEIKSPILILGDRMGEHLYKFAEPLSEILSQGLIEPIQIQSWAKNGDGFHRSLKKLNSLKTLPKVIIFHGLSQEFLELRFKVKEMEAINYNFNIYQNPKVQTSLYFFPIISRYLYDYAHRVSFQKKIIPFLPNQQSKRQLIDIQGLTFKVLEYELESFIKKIKKDGSILVFITTPINYEVMPQRACTGSSSTRVKELINSAEDYISRGLLKKGLSILKDDKLKNIPNPYLYYLRGKVHQNLMEYSQAMNMYQLASSFDCKLWRTTPVLNNILKKAAQKNNILLFDFAQMVDDDFFVNETFLNALYPQDFYYERLVQILGRQLKEILNL